MERTRSTDAYGMEVLRLIEGSPQEHGYRRPTWTQELLVLVLAERTGIRVSVTTMCRLLRRLGIRLNRPKPTVDCPWPKVASDAAIASDSTAGRQPRSG